MKERYVTIKNHVFRDYKKTIYFAFAAKEKKLRENTSKCQILLSLGREMKLQSTFISSFRTFTPFLVILGANHFNPMGSFFFIYKIRAILVSSQGSRK